MNAVALGVLMVVMGIISVLLIIALVWVILAGISILWEYRKDNKRGDAPDICDQQMEDCITQKKREFEDVLKQIEGMEALLHDQVYIPIKAFAVVELIQRGIIDCRLGINGKVSLNMRSEDDMLDTLDSRHLWDYFLKRGKLDGESFSIGFKPDEEIKPQA